MTTTTAEASGKKTHAAARRRKKERQNRGRAALEAPAPVPYVAPAPAPVCRACGTGAGSEKRSACIRQRSTRDLRVSAGAFAIGRRGAAARRMTRHFFCFGRISLSLLDVFVGFRGFLSNARLHRRSVFGFFLVHGSSFAPAVYASLEYYPGKHIPEPGLLDYIGLLGWFEYGLPPAATDKTAGATYLAHELRPRRRKRAISIGPRKKLGLVRRRRRTRLAYPTVRGTVPSNGVVLSTQYTFVRPALDVWVSASSRFSVKIEGGYRAVTDSGAASKDFPRAFVGGVDGRLSLSVRVVSGLWLRLSGDYVRYFYTFNPKPGDPLHCRRRARPTHQRRFWSSAYRL